LKINSSLTIFFAQGLSFTRLWNCFLSEVSFRISNLIKKPIVWGHPRVVKIEPSSVCNLKCPLCHTTRGLLKRGGGFLDFELYKQIVDSLSKKTTMITLSHMGEPFLHRNFLDMVVYARSQGFIVLGISNMNVCFDAKELVKSGISKLNVSIDGITQGVYEKYRVAGSLKLALSNIRKIADAKILLKSKTPIISFRYMYFSHNKHEDLQDIRKVARECGANELKIVKPFIIGKEDTKYLDQDNSNYEVDSDGYFRVKYDIPNRCRAIWDEMVIDFNGEVEICCFDKLQKIIGNVKQDKIMKIWKGKKLNNFRGAILKDRKSIDACSICFNGAGLWEQKEIFAKRAKTVKSI